MRCVVHDVWYMMSMCTFSFFVVSRCNTHLIEVDILIHSIYTLVEPVPTRRGDFIKLSY